ncbi:MAG: DUF305 domain-containing protein [Mycobacterium sp.]
MTSPLSGVAARMVAGLAALATAVVLSACTTPAAPDGHTDHTHAESSPVISTQPADFNADDVAFATDMTPHHQQAIEMSAMVPDHTTNPQVIALAKEISAAQGPEIDTFKALLVQWQEDPGADSAHGGHGDMAMNGMVDDPTMQRLDSLKGPEFDTLWLQSMIGHHQGAIEMAKAELAKGENVDAKQLAQNIVSTQQTEIDQMKQMLGTS